jgi:hypothetical protein
MSDEDSVFPPGTPQLTPLCMALEHLGNVLIWYLLLRTQMPRLPLIAESKQLQSCPWQAASKPKWSHVCDAQTATIGLVQSVAFAEGHLPLDHRESVHGTYHAEPVNARRDLNSGGASSCPRVALWVRRIQVKCCLPWASKFLSLRTPFRPMPHSEPRCLVSHCLPPRLAGTWLIEGAFVSVALR